MRIWTILSLLMMFIGPVESQVYSWTVPNQLQVPACSGASFLNLSWTYTPINPAPLSIGWSKLLADGVTVDKTIATDSGTFTPVADYIGRVSRVGNAAEISIQTPGAADGGFYKVSVLDSGGLSLEGGATVTFIIPASVTSSGITAASSGSVATCSGLLSHGSPPAALSISYGTFSNTTTTELTINTTVSSKQTVLCSLTGLAADCLTGVRLNDSVEVEPTRETTLSPTSTTEPPDSNVSTTAATNTTTTITSTVIPTTVTENSSQSSIDIQLSVLVPVVSLVVIILIIIVVYCVVVSFRNRRAKENERNSKDQFSMNNKL